jgi:hypothetical protein
MGKKCSMHWEMRDAYTILVMKKKAKDHLKGISIDRILENWNVKV